MSFTAQGTITGNITSEGTLSASLAAENALEGSLTVPHVIKVDNYDGVVSVAPSDTPTVLSTKDKFLLDDITIEPIPQNYGLITWNGSVLTVS